MGPVVTVLLPQYAEALVPARIFIFIGVTTGLASLTAIGVVAADQQRLLPGCAGAGAFLNPALS